MRKTAKSLWISVMALLLCFSMLLGTTYAWFTDTVESGNNEIIAGNLDVEMYWSKDLSSGNWINAEDANAEPIFNHDKWEPGYTEVRYVKIVNAGNLALKYGLSIIPDGEVSILADVIDVYYVENATENIADRNLTGLTSRGTLRDAIIGKIPVNGVLLPNGKTPANGQYAGEVVIAIALQMDKNAGNEYMNKSIGDSFSIQLVASQYNYESDSFDSDYDSGVELPAPIVDSSVSTNVTPDADNKVPAGGATLDGGSISANVPAGVQMEQGATSLTLSVSNIENSNANITLGENEVQSSIDVHMAGVATSNSVPMEITLLAVAAKGMNHGNLKLYHVENGSTREMTYVALDAAFTAHNQFKYDPATGDIILYMATFSEVAVVSDTVNAWEGKFDYSWYTKAVAPVDGEAVTEYIIANADQLAAFGAIVGGMNGQTQDSFAGKTVKLVADINLGDDEKNNNEKIIFYPIGYWNNEGTYERKPLDERTTAVESGFYSFEGTFDGNGNTIENFYQNTWEMKGDHNWYDPIKEQYYRDGMGLFGRVYKGTVKNLTVKNFSSDGEIATTGVIAAYADGATFENIAIFNCNPRVYNIGNGGIVGCVGWYAKEANLKTTFKNITVDNSNKISALWGSYDVACGGIVGQYYPTSGQTSAGTPKNGGIDLVNCHVSAQMDVYNDVCGNYQYYAYRYAGMIIGSIRENTTNEDGKTIPDMTGISATGCTVNYGDWNDYYYCEFEKNGHPSYSGPDDYKFSRVPHSELNFTDSNGNGLVDANERDSVTGCKHNHTDAENNNMAIYLPFHQLFTGYGWGVNSIGLEKYSGIVTNLDITEGEQEESVVKFETKFTGDFLYRVGNQNTVSIGALFKAKDGVTINNSGVIVSVQKVDKNSNVSGTFTANTTDWTKGTIKFSGTGVVKVTIQDYNFCKPTELLLEVVEATNYASSTISSLGSGNVALLCDTKLNNNGALALQNASLYGNGFTIDVTAGKTAGESITANYLLYMNNATIDNVQVVGAVYTNFDVISSNSWNNPVILSVGNSTIANSYISNCASPVRLRSGNLNIINSTLKGGFFANLDIRGGNVVLDNVTTINQANLNDKSADGKEIVGMGVVVYYEGPSADTTITIKNNLTQYNYLENKQTSNSYANMLIDEIFGNASKYQAALFTDANGIQWANTGVVSLSEEFGKNVFASEQSNSANFTGIDLSYTHPQLGNVKGYLYVSNPKVLYDSYTYIPNAQYEIVPKVSFDHKINEVVKTDDSETTCTSDPLTDSESIAFADGDSFEWNVNILKSSNKDITYTVWVDGVQYTDKIVFSESGTHTVVFKYSDANNYRRSGDTVEKYTVEYQISMDVIVTEKEAAAKSAEIIFPLLESYGTTKVTVDGKTYIMPNLTGTNIPKYGDDLTFDASTRKYGSLKSDSRSTVDIYYPIIKTAISGNYMVYPVFGNKNGTLVQIQDYADNGAGAALTPYNASTQTMPAGLSVVRGYTVQWSTDKDVVGSGSMSYGGWTNGLLCMKYQSSSDDIACKVMSNYLSYYPNINLRSNDRNEQVTVVEYKYVDNKGDTYYYCVGYHIEKRNSGYAFGEKVPEKTSPCVTPDTLVTLADGTQKRIDQVTYADKLLVWDFYKGEYAAVPAAIIFDHGYGDNTVIKLDFSNGASVKVVNMHQFFDATLNKMVTINASNVAQYVGHEFICQDGDGYSTVTLDAYTVTNEYVEAWGIMSSLHYNIIVEGIFSADFDPADLGLFNYFEIGEDMKYDAEKMQADIEEYGLYTYEDFADYLTYEQFVAFNVQYFKIPVEKGLYTYEGILALIDEYLK